MAERSHLSIGEVLSLLRDEFPDVTISKIRFLESQGLVDPERTPSGYRKFYDPDVERLRWILRQQREHYMPLKVIRSRLSDRAGDGTDAPPPAGTESGGAWPAGAPSTPSEPTGGNLMAPAAGLIPEPGVATAVASPAGSPVVSPAGSPVDSPAGSPGVSPAGSPGVSPAGSPGVSSADIAGRPDSAPAQPWAPAGPTASPSPGGSPGGLPPGGLPPGGSPGGLPPGGSPGGPLAAGAQPGSGAPPTPPGDSHQDPSAPPPPGEQTPAPSRAAATPSLFAGLHQSGTGGSNPSPAPPPARMRRPEPPTPPRAAFDAEEEPESYSAEELAHAAGVDASLVGELKQYGLIAPQATVAGTQYYDDSALAVTRAAAGLARHGVEARHLRIWRNSADRETDLMAQVVLPLLRQRNPQARRQAHDTLEELTRAGADLRAALVARAIREIR